MATETLTTEKRAACLVVPLNVSKIKPQKVVFLTAMMLANLISSLNPVQLHPRVGSVRKSNLFEQSELSLLAFGI